MLIEIYLFPFIGHLNGLQKSLDFNFGRISYSRFLDAETEWHFLKGCVLYLKGIQDILWLICIFFLNIFIWSMLILNIWLNR